MIFQRKIDERLNGWRKDPYRKPLVIRGARQTGKTTAIDRFGASFTTYIKLNMDLSEDRQLFEKDLPMDQLIQQIAFYKHAVFTDDTLLFIDEIQGSAKAVEMLRYFYEMKPELYVVCAGSLLEVMMEKEQISFPVGRVQYAYMYPMTFDEFLLARNETEALQIMDTVPFPDYALARLVRLYQEYMLVGGMPEAVSRYVDTGSAASLDAVYRDLLTSFNDDVSKYAKGQSEAAVIRHVMETSPMETGERITFQNFGNSSYGAREVGNALRTLQRAMILYLRYPVTAAAAPFLPNRKKKPRLQYLDIGLMNYACGIQAQYYSGMDLNDLYRGNAAEQITGQQLLSASCEELKEPFFWTRENRSSNAEVDFILTNAAEAIPVEVKSGKSGRLRSLQSYVDISGCKKAVRLYSGPYQTETVTTVLQHNSFELISLPLFLATRIDRYLG